MVVLGAVNVTPAQVTALTDWVNAGGNLITLKPTGSLSGLLGITATGSTPLSDGYLKVDNTTAAGAGIASPTLQYHGPADLYQLTGAAAVATLYSNATTATTNPAVTLDSVGTSGGQAAAFTYDLPRRSSPCGRETRPGRVRSATGAHRCAPTTSTSAAWAATTG